MRATCSALTDGSLGKEPERLAALSIRRAAVSQVNGSGSIKVDALELNFLRLGLEDEAPRRATSPSSYFPS